MSLAGDQRTTMIMVKRKRKGGASEGREAEDAVRPSKGLGVGAAGSPRSACPNVASRNFKSN